MKHIRSVLGLILCLWGAVFSQEETRDTVYVEEIVRATAYVALKPKADTIYLNADGRVEAGPREYAEEQCCRPTEANPFGRDTTKLPRNDTSYTHRFFYLNFDVVSIIWMLDESLGLKVGGNIEISFNRKNSMVFNVRYGKKYPETSGGDVFSSIYEGYIEQYDIGAGYRHYTRPARSSFFYEVGGNFLLRKSNYTNTWDAKPNLINDRPHSDYGSYKGFALYAHGGHAFRGNWATFGFEYGFSYNIVPSFDKEILSKHVMYIADGLQLDLKVNIGVGFL